MPKNNVFNVNTPVNNAMYDPLQGFDVDVYAIDQATGVATMFARFAKIQIIIRTTTEMYLTLFQRMPRYLDGEINIEWQMESGLVDSRILQQTFGFDSLSPDEYIKRMPRFQIHFLMDSPGLVDARRDATGQLVLTFCKVDALTLAATAGRSVVANRWEGVAEGIKFVDTFKRPMKDSVLQDNPTEAVSAIYRGAGSVLNDIFGVKYASKMVSIPSFIQNQPNPFNSNGGATPLTSPTTPANFNFGVGSFIRTT